MTKRTENDRGWSCCIPKISSERRLASLKSADFGIVVMEFRTNSIHAMSRSFRLGGEGKIPSMPAGFGVHI
jgi:hypothetical protein